MGYQTIPFKAYSQGTLTDTTWSLFNATSVALPVSNKKATFLLPANYLPNTTEPYGSAWKSTPDGELTTYFAPNQTFTGYTDVSLQFLTNFTGGDGQQVKIDLVASDGIVTSLVPWTLVKLVSGTGTPTLVGQITKVFEAGKAYWVEVTFEKTISNKTGFLTKYHWAIQFVPAPPPADFEDQEITAVESLLGTGGH